MAGSGKSRAAATRPRRHPTTWHRARRELRRATRRVRLRPRLDHVAADPALGAVDDAPYPVAIAVPAAGAPGDDLDLDSRRERLTGRHAVVVGQRHRRHPRQRRDERARADRQHYAHGDRHPPFAITSYCLSDVPPVSHLRAPDTAWVSAPAPGGLRIRPG